jgi:glycosyltransferase involved in cell wall biosynthesis
VFGRVFSASRVSALKNVAGLIRGFQATALQFPSAELRIAGRDGGAYAAECRGLVRELHLESQVRFLGPLAVPEIRHELARASCLALTSFRENAPLVISEAQAAGVPVLASRVGGIPYMIEEGVNGRLVDPTSPADISRGLKQLHDGDNLAAFGRAARERADRSCRPAVVARQTLDVYRQILGQSCAAAMPDPRHAEIREFEPAGF